MIIVMNEEDFEQTICFTLADILICFVASFSHPDIYSRRAVTGFLDWNIPLE